MARRKRNRHDRPRSPASPAPSTPARRAAPAPGFFLPRVTLMMAGGVLLSVLLLGLYAMPAVTAPVPPGAVVDYRTERVRARLEGKVPWIVTGAFLASGLLVHGLLVWRERRATS